MTKWVIYIAFIIIILTGCGRQSDIQTNELTLNNIEELSDLVDEEYKKNIYYRIPTFQIKDRNMVMYENGDNKIIFAGEVTTDHNEYTEIYYALKAVGDFDEVPEIDSLQMHPITSLGKQEKSLLYVYELTDSREKYYIYRAPVEKGNRMLRLDFGINEDEINTLSLDSDLNSLVIIGGIEQFPPDVETFEEPLDLVGNQFVLSILEYGPSFDRDGLLQNAVLIDFSLITEEDAEVKIKLMWPGLELPGPEGDELFTNQVVSAYKGIAHSIPRVRLPMDERNTIYNSIVKIDVSLDNNEPTVFYFDLINRKIVENNFPSVVVHQAIYY